MIDVFLRLCIYLLHVSRTRCHARVEGSWVVLSVATIELSVKAIYLGCGTSYISSFFYPTRDLTERAITFKVSSLPGKTKDFTWLFRKEAASCQWELLPHRLLTSLRDFPSRSPPFSFFLLSLTFSLIFFGASLPLVPLFLLSLPSC